MIVIEGKKICRVRGEGDLAKEILKGIDISIMAGESVAIIGKSGAGKSTLLHQLAALDVPTSGQVIVNDKDVNKLSEEELANFRLYTFGYVFQDYALLKDLSAVENVQIPLLMRGIDFNEAEQKAKSMLDTVGLADKYGNLPTELSGGEQQRVSIARAIVGKPQILFADEPTANLDSRSGKAIIDLFAELNKSGQTIVMVTHETEYTTWCDRVVSLEDGLIKSSYSI